MSHSYVFTSESVTPGHPDKLCDQISDAIVDRFLEYDRGARINAECAVAHGVAFIAVNFASTANVDIPEIARTVIADVGYEQGEFNAADCSVMTSVRELPIEQRFAVDESALDDGAIDAIAVQNQVNVFGYACRQTESLMPLPISLAHRLCKRLHGERDNLACSALSPDGTVQVGVEYVDRIPRRLHSINVSLHAQAACSTKQLHDDVFANVIAPTFENESMRPDADTRIFVNQTGPILNGGPVVHSGLTGRKTAVDNYGEYARHSESAQSGKDPLRIDRIAAYAARHAAKNIVAAGLAEECELLLSYSLGQAQPVSVQIDTFDTAHYPHDIIYDVIDRHFDFRLAAIMRDFELRDLPQRHDGCFYRRLAAYGQVGRNDLELPWELTDKADAIKRSVDNQR